MTSTSPAGRSSTTTLDALGRVTQVQAPGVLPVQIAYDARGRPQSVTQGARSSSFTYDANGNLAGVTDPLSRTTTLTNDALGRPLTTTLP